MTYEQRRSKAHEAWNCEEGDDGGECGFCAEGIDRVIAAFLGDDEVTGGASYEWKRQIMKHNVLVPLSKEES